MGGRGCLCSVRHLCGHMLAAGHRVEMEVSDGAKPIWWVMCSSFADCSGWRWYGCVHLTARQFSRHAWWRLDPQVGLVSDRQAGVLNPQLSGVSFQP